MALTKAQVREILSSAGVDGEHMSDAVERIIAGHTASIEALREKATTLEATVNEKQAEIEKLSGVEQELKDLKKQVEDDAKAREGKDYDKLAQEFSDYKAEIEKRDAHAAKVKAFREILKDADIDEKYHDKIIKYSDIDSIELDADSKVKDAKDRIKAVREEWPEYKVTQEEKGADTPKPPANDGKGVTREQIEAIKDASERQKAMIEHHELFNF